MGSLTLADFAKRFNSDKLDHGYCPFYESLFAPRRNEPIRILELGIGGFEYPDDPDVGGESLRLWEAYFPQSAVVGVDILDKSGVQGGRITVVQGSQVDEDLLGRLVREHGPFDIIIDDASHIPELTCRSFELLFPKLADGGIYVIEDVSTSYWPTWGGRFRRQPGGATMAMVKARLDGLNHIEWKLPNAIANELDRTILEIRARHNIVALVKGDNTITSDLNRAQPVTTKQWLLDDVAPAIAFKAQKSSLPKVLERLHLRRPVRALRRHLFPDLHR